MTVFKLLVKGFWPLQTQLNILAICASDSLAFALTSRGILQLAAAAPHSFKASPLPRPSTTP